MAAAINDDVNLLDDQSKILLLKLFDAIDNETDVM